MLTVTLTRCLSVFLVMFFVCPKGTHLSASIGQRYFRAMGARPHPKFGRTFKSMGMYNRKPLKLLYDKDDLPPLIDTSRKTDYFTSTVIYSNKPKRWTTYEGTFKRPLKLVYYDAPGKTNHKKISTYGHLKYEPSSNEKISSQLTELDHDDSKNDGMSVYYDPIGKKTKHPSSNKDAPSHLDGSAKLEYKPKIVPLSKENTSSQYESDVSEETGGVSTSNFTKPLFLIIPTKEPFRKPLLPAVKRPEVPKFDGDSKIPLKLIQGLELLSSAEKDTWMELGFDLTPEEMEKFKIWENAEVPYYIDVISFKDKVLRDQIRTMLDEVNSLTRLNFVELPRPPANDETRWVLFVNRIGQLTCSEHSIQDLNTTGVQRVVLGYECMSTGRELAEAVLAIAGVPPQHNSPDRDQYIKVNVENVMPGKEYLFEKLDDKDWLFHNTGYDYESAGHFDTHKHSENGKATIEFRPPHSQSAVRELRGLSNNDIWKISMLYNFISTKNKGEEPACSKLFSPGENLNNMRDPFQKKSIPRPKSNKYLGIENVEKPLKDVEIEVEEYSGPSSPDGPDGSDDSNIEPRKNNTNSEQYDETSNLESNAEYMDNSIHDDSFNYDENTQDESGKKKLLNGKQKLKRIPQPYANRDPLLYLSDYDTDNELYERSRVKKTKGSKVHKQEVRVSS